jgi:hypothetical protein
VLDAQRRLDQDRAARDVGVRQSILKRRAMRQGAAHEGVLYDEFGRPSL